MDRELGSGGIVEVQEADAGQLTTDLCTRVSSFFAPDQLARVDIAHIDQLAARVLSENAVPGSCRRRIDDVQALGVLRQVLAKIGDQRLADDFLLEEWDQVVLGQSPSTRKEYTDARRAGRGRSLTRPGRNQVWKLPEQFTGRLDRDGVETRGQVAERAARDEATRATTITENGEHGGESSETRHRHHRYRHVIVDEAQDPTAARWTMLRAMVAIGVVAPGTVNYDDLDDGTDALDANWSVLRVAAPELIGYNTWSEELDALAEVVARWRDDITTGDGQARPDPHGSIAFCVVERGKTA